MAVHPVQALLPQQQLLLVASLEQPPHQLQHQQEEGAFLERLPHQLKAAASLEVAVQPPLRAVVPGSSERLQLPLQQPGLAYLEEVPRRLPQVAALGSLGQLLPVLSEVALQMRPLGAALASSVAVVQLPPQLAACLEVVVQLPRVEAASLVEEVQ